MEVCPNTFVTQSFILNVTGLLDPTLKHIGNFNLRQIIPFAFFMFKASKKNKHPHTRTTCQIYSKLKAAEWTSGASIVNFEHILHFILLLLLLNSIEKL